MGRWKLLGCASLFAVAAIGGVSGVQTAAAGSEPPAGSESPQPGGTLTFADAIEPAVVDPIRGYYSTAIGDAPVFYALYDVLVMEDPVTTEVVPKLAESLTTDDGLVWTLKLRPDVEFTDGTPLDAEAVKFNIERYANPDNASANLSIAQAVAAMEVVDPLTLEIRLDSPNVEFDRMVAKFLGYIASPTALQADPDGFSEAPVGAGPFMLTEWTRGSRMVFKRNPNYWDSPRPYVDELIILFQPDFNQRLNSFEVGETDFTTSSFSPLLAIRAAEAGFPAVALPSTVGGGQVLFNVTKPPFDDVRVRQAFHLAIDRQALSDALFEGGDRPVEHIIREPSPFYAAEQVLPAYDHAEAQRLIDEYVAENGPIDVKYLSGPDQRIPELIQSQVLSLEGVSVNIESIQSNEFVPRLGTGDFQLASWAGSSLAPEPQIYLEVHSGSTQNYIGYSDPEMDQALDLGRTSTDPQERADAYETVQRLLIRDMPLLWLTENRITYPYHENVHGLVLNGTAPLLERIWVDQ